MPQKVADYRRKSPESGDSGDFWWRLLDSNQWPHACEDSIGTPSADFRKNKAGLPRDFLTRRYSPFHCFRPGFSVRGSRRGSKRDPRFLFAAGRMPSYNKAALSCSKAGFLTEYTSSSPANFFFRTPESLCRYYTILPLRFPVFSMVSELFCAVQ